MRIVFGLLLLLGLGLAGFAIHAAQGQFAAYRTALASTQQAVIPIADVVVAVRSLSYGEYLAQEDVQVVPWPAEHVPAGAFTDLAALFPEDAEGPRTVLRMIEPDEPMLASKVTEPGQSAGVAATLASGMRAFSFQVDLISGVSGFLRPGDRVDVYWTGSDGDGGVTRLIHPNLQLIAIDQVTDGERASPQVARTVTVEVPPQVVAKLAQATATGRLTLALVGVHDEGESEAVEATIAEIIGPRETVEASRVCSVRARRGSEVVETQVPCPSGS